MPVTENVIRLLARYSEGLRLAVEHGPRSGLVLEYAFQNEPQGSGVLGRWIDRTFLQLRAWESIRTRISTTKDLVGEIVAQRRAVGFTTMILDVASGTARYLRDLAREQGGEDLVVACQDRDPKIVMQGRQLVEAQGLARFTFSVGDATDSASYLTNRDPDIILAVGLFPYLYCDDDVRTVIRLAYQHLSQGGCFLCTTLAKPHARLPHWEADPFAAGPAVRSPDVIARWLRAAGFKRIEQRFSQPDGCAVFGWKPDSA
jgi:SAM-dependent methyltransferase